MTATRYLACMVLWFCAGLANAQAPVADPWKDWMSADSANFRVHYRSEHRPQAERAIRAAERAYPRITAALQWEPRGRTEIVLFNEYDLPNGYATPLPYNTIGVILAPPDEGSLLENSDWLDLLLTHEFTHTVHLDKVRGAPKVLQSIFGRVPWFFPNVFQPLWALEGLATHLETDAPRGRGRLHGPTFEALLRAQASQGFPTLAELNADGRTLPIEKAYLYGAYFYDFIARRYGKDAIFRLVEQYSGNIVPRVHTNPREITGKTMDLLWDEFIADLRQRVAERSEALRRQPEAVGQRVIGPLFDIGAIAALPSGTALAVIDDGLGPTQLVRVGKDGQQQAVARVNRGTRLDVAPNGQVLLMQPDVCNSRYLAYDLYRVEEDYSLRQLTDCARLRRAVQVGDSIAALQHEGGRTRMLLLDAQGREQRVLLEAVEGADLIDLALAPQSRRLSVISRSEGHWRVLEIDLDRAEAPPRLLFTHNAPIHTLRHGPAGLEFIAQADGVFNVWRHEGAELVRLTHSHTSVLTHGGSSVDGALWMVVIAANGQELRRLASRSVLQKVAAPQLAAPAQGDQATGLLGEGRSYLALRALYPRSWLPAITFDRGLQALGASTFGGDALNWHQYAATAQWENTQNELLGAVEYLFIGQHHLALGRNLKATAWLRNGDEDETTAYERHTKAQWLSLFPLIKLQRTLSLGVGAALDRIEQVQVGTPGSPRSRDEQLAAALIEFDTSGGNWWSEGRNRGQRSGLLIESYRPFARSGGMGYDGTIARVDLRGYLPVGRSVLAARHTEVYARGRTEPYQLGGAVDAQLQLGTALNDRELALRGYRGDEAQLLGQQARVTSVEWRMPLVDLDRHAMSPPIGLNRLSAAAFFDIGGAWNSGRRPNQYYRGIGVELLGEVRLLYALGLQLRAGLAVGLDEPGDAHGYLSVGRPF